MDEDVAPERAVPLQGSPATPAGRIAVILPLPGELNADAAIPVTVPAVHPSLDRDEPEPARSVWPNWMKAGPKSSIDSWSQSSISDMRHVPTMRIWSPAPSPLLPSLVGVKGLLGRSSPQSFHPGRRATQTALAGSPDGITAT